MTWPEIGSPLPRVQDAYAPPEKWSLWILSEQGHGPHWRGVFGAVDAERLWESIAVQAGKAPISFVRDLGVHGHTCRVPMRLTLNGRTADVVTVWQYETEDAAPRLVTAYPTT